MNPYLIELLRNNINSDKLNNILYLYNVLDKAHMYEITEEIDNIGDIDTLDIDITTLDLKVIILLKDGIKEYLKYSGIVLDSEFYENLSLYEVVDFIFKLNHLYDIDTSIAEHIVDTIPDDMNTVDALYFILSNIDNTIDADLYYNLVVDVYDKLISNTITSYKNLSDEITDLDNVSLKIESMNTDLQELFKVNSIPDLLEEYINDKKTLLYSIKNNFSEYKSSLFKRLNFYIAELGFKEELLNKFLLQLVILYYYSEDEDWYKSLVLDLIDKVDDKYEFTSILNSITEYYIKHNIIGESHEEA